ncbi:MAG: hypothetical protein IPK74_33345 [Deltaproteobacteria bacterium]|nr:hypothetical protein [Deltaproteobacteria bacterium]
MHTKIILMLGSLVALTVGGVWGGTPSASAGERAIEQVAADASTTVVAMARLDTAAPTVSEAGSPPLSMAPRLRCVEMHSSTKYACKDAGNFDSTCATAKCGEGYVLTGGGGSCAAGNRKIKTLAPNVSTGEFSIMCEQQGTAPQADAVCCKL